MRRAFARDTHGPYITKNTAGTQDVAAIASDNDNLGCMGTGIHHPRAKGSVGLTDGKMRKGTAFGTCRMPIR